MPASSPSRRGNAACSAAWRARSARVHGGVLPASTYHALHVQLRAPRMGTKVDARWVTVPIAIVALRRDAGRTAALATRLSARRPPPPPGRGDGLASAAGFSRRPRNTAPSAERVAARHGTTRPPAYRGPSDGGHLDSRQECSVACGRTSPRRRTTGTAHRSKRVPSRRRARRAQRGGGSAAAPRTRMGRPRYPANETKPPTTAPYATWAARLTSGVCGP